MSRGQYAPSSIYTRRQSTDVFYNDPFKIQSYNFRYADRPVYHVQQYQRPEPPQSKPLTFETYYQNPKFITRCQEPKAAPATSAFAENRRRRFLNDFKCISSLPNKVNNVMVSTEPRKDISLTRRQLASSPPAAVSNFPLLRTCCNRDEYQTMRRGQSFTTIRQSTANSNVNRRCGRSASVCTLKEPEKKYSTCTFKVSPRRSASNCSGCAINININGLESEAELDKSLRIKIETDACLHNNTDNYKVHKSTARIGSSDSFVIDKRLSKFSLPEARAQTNSLRKANCEQDLLIAKRLQVHMERKRMEQMCQQELQKEHQRMRQRDQERERFRQLERQRDHERLLEIEAERERHRLRGLEREAQRKREYERVRCYQEQLWQDRQMRLPMRATSLPTSVASPVIMTSHLYRPASTDRLPGMVPCYVHQSAASASTQTARAERLQNCTRNLTTLRCLKPQISPQPERTQYDPPPARTLERRSSGSSNYNASVLGSASNASLQQRRLSATRLNERKLLNLHVNGMPVSSSQPIHTRINNMPIRITTSQPVGEDTEFSLNRVRVRNASPAACPVHERRRSCSSDGYRNEESASMPYNVSINVYTDNLRTMRL
ncbi:protein PRRC2C [Drosophila montana]|uniref:protein PRRC2C n=1 Tax=Drosophila montana TaxID=40370 RepID=UPI00313C6474